MADVLSVRRYLIALEVIGNVGVWQSAPGELGHIELAAVNDAAALIRAEEHGRGRLAGHHRYADGFEFLPDHLDEIVRRRRTRIVLEIDRKLAPVLRPNAVGADFPSRRIENLTCLPRIVR